MATVLSIRNVTVIDGTSPAPRPHQDVEIRDGVIVAVNPTDAGEPPAGATVVDGKGKYLIPGLWDAHVHLSKAKSEALPVLVANGVTSVRDMGGDPEELRGFRDSIERGQVVGPRIRMAGPMIEAPETLERLAAQETAEDWRRTRVPVPDAGSAARIVDSIAALGVDFLKIREAATPEIYEAVANAARERGIPLAGHPPFSLDPVRGASLGLVSFEHGSYPYPLPDDSTERAGIIEAFRSSGVYLVPTLAAWETQLMDHDSLMVLVLDTAGLRNPRMRLLSPNLVHEWRVDVEDSEPKTKENLQGWLGFFHRNAADIGVLHDAGIPMLPGTDLAGPALFPGYSLHRELELLVDAAGLSPWEALRAATLEPAEMLGLADSVGTIRPGQAADLVLLSKDPLADIRHARDIVGVLRRGVYYDEQAIMRMLGGLTPLETGSLTLRQEP
ncbi:MAG: amidohydrolase family protein [Gemmatimonadota bacterium]